MNTWYRAGVHIKHGMPYYHAETNTLKFKTQTVTKTLGAPRTFDFIMEDDPWIQFDDERGYAVWSTDKDKAVELRDAAYQRITGETP